jgi:hypothetical protein
LETKLDEYRRKAEEADELAKSARDLSARTMYQQVAAHYRYLAGQHERMKGWI